MRRRKSLLQLDCNPGVNVKITFIGYNRYRRSPSRQRDVGNLRWVRRQNRRGTLWRIFRSITKPHSPKESLAVAPQQSNTCAKKIPRKMRAICAVFLKITKNESEKSMESKRPTTPSYAFPLNLIACASAKRASSRRRNFFRDSALRNQLSGSSGRRRMASFAASNAS